MFAIMLFTNSSMNELASQSKGVNALKVMFT